MRQAAIVLCFSVILLAQSQPPSPRPAITGQEQQQNRGDEKSPDNNPGLAVINEQKGSGAQQSKWPSMPDGITVFTGILAIAAIIQILVYKQQANLMKEALAETEKAANAATKSANIASESLMIAHRAYVGIKSITLAHSCPKSATYGNAISDMEVQITCLNTGATRGREFFVSFEIFLDQLTGPAGTAFKAYELRTQPTSINPHGGTELIKSPTIEAMFPTANSEILKAAFAQKLFRVSGEVHYRDVFKFGFTLHCKAVQGEANGDPRTSSGFKLTTDLESDVRA